MRDFHEEETLGKAYDTRLMRRLLAYARPFWGWVFLCIVLLLFITAADLARPYLIKIAIDDHLTVVYRVAKNSASPGNTVNLKALRSEHLQGLLRLVYLYLGIITAGFLLNCLQTYLLHYTGQRIIYRIRQELFAHLQRLSLSYFDRNPVGRLVTRVANDTEALNEMYTNVLVNLFGDLFIIAGIVVVMLRLNLQLALVSFTVIPLIVVVTVVFRLRAREAYRRVRVKLARINAALQENISGMKIVQVFNRQARQFEEFREVNREHYLAGMQQLKVFAVFRPTLDLIRYFALALLVWYGGRAVLNENLQFGVLYAFVNYIDRLFRPINDLSEKYNIMQSAMASSERIFMLLDSKEEVPNPKNPRHLGRVRGQIEFENVWFAYKEGEWVLRDVSFEVKPGETVAIVGPTGAGKSSIINLICRFYDPQAGRVLVDGIDVKQVKKEDLRRQIGVVLQDVFLFSGDIKGNIRLNNEGISEQRVAEVAGYVNADRFIDRLPHRYDETVQERGSTLSAGERQLLALARALAFDPAVLVLDEATASIDTETEALIQEALARVIRGRTTIVVAHRLSTIKNADRILVVHKGGIREVGSHQELLNRRGLYHDLYLLQYR